MNRAKEIIIASELMVELGFEWDENERAWMPPEEPVSQSEAINAAKKLLAASKEAE